MVIVVIKYTHNDEDEDDDKESKRFWNLSTIKYEIRVEEMA